MGVGSMMEDDRSILRLARIVDNMVLVDCAHLLMGLRKHACRRFILSTRDAIEELSTLPCCDAVI